MQGGDQSRNFMWNSSVILPEEVKRVLHPPDHPTASTFDGATVAPIETVKAAHFSEDKSGVDQIPIDVLIEWGQVYTFGAKKYGRDNWKLGTDYHEFYGSALRHLFAFWGGEDIDPESGLSHLAHALWNIAAIRHYQNKGLGTDDRPTRI